MQLITLLQKYIENNVNSI